MKYFSSKRLIISGVFIVLVVMLLVLISSDLFTYSRYETNVTSQNSITTAVYLLDDEYQTINVRLPDIIPGNNQYTYSFSISNYNEDLHSDTNLKYRLHIRTTTNLNIDYKLYDSDGSNLQNATPITVTSSVDQDVYGTYFNNIYTDYETMLYSEDKTDNYTIVFTYPVNPTISPVPTITPTPTPSINYKDAKYSGVPELIEITIESKQILQSDI